MLNRLSRSGLLLSLLGVCMLFLVGLLTLVASPQPEAEPFMDRSIFNSGPSGYRAWMLVNQKSGLPLIPWQQSFSDLKSLPRPAVMVIVEPYTVARSQVIFGRKEAEALLDWVAQGNTLILLDDFKRYGSQHLLRRLELTLNSLSPPAEPQILQVPKRASLLTTYLQRPVVSKSPHRFESKANARYPATVLLEDQAHRPALLRIPYGAGTLMVGTPTDLASNHYLHTPPNDNHQFLSNVLSLEHKPVYINEFVHGYNEITDVFSWYRQKTPLGDLFTQLLFGFAFVLWLSFVRWTPKPSQPATGAKTGPPPQIFLQSLASVYYRTQAAPLALKPQLDQLDLSLRQRYQVKLSDEGGLQDLLANLFADYSSKDESPAMLLAAIRKAQDIVERGTRASHRETLKLARQLTFIQERLQHGYRRNATSGIRR